LHDAVVGVHRSGADVVIAPDDERPAVCFGEDTMTRSITVSELDVAIPVDDVELAGVLSVPSDVSGIVVIPLRSSEGRDSDSARQLADALHRQGLATLLLDLLTDDEQWLDDLHPRRTMRDDRLATRLAAAVDHFVNDLEGGPRLPMSVLATGAALPIVTQAQLPIPTIPSLIGAGEGMRGRAHIVEDWIHRPATSPGVGVAA